MPSKRKLLVELTFPSVFGYEKVAMAAVAAFARRHGIAGERVNDLCTAVAEACINAIEYGNAANAHVPVTVRFSVDGHRLIVEVCDQALGVTRPAMGSMVDPDHPPSGPHGNMGLFLIYSLMDEVDIVCRPHGTQVHMAMLLPQPLYAS